ncbi:unnamed protein product [Plutella xylostella]|uniref:(diamondback moth) hypothetical protein n=1 Tax=Plutella xylostella TaxID=51655 RepID=A0A8S4F1R1_PLUXY|nr:unnamed protein product [Plutella xylostella]
MTLGRKHTQSSGNAGDIRKVYASHSKVGSLSTCSSSISLNDMIEPPDWEEVSERLMGENDPLAYPPDDVNLVTVPKKIRTVEHVLPDEDLSKASMFVRDCIRTYTSNYSVVEYAYRCYSGSVIGRERLLERLERVGAAPPQQYEVDMEPQQLQDLQTESQSQPSSGRQSVASMSSSSSCNETLTPRGSWASLDLRSSSSDPLLPDLFDKKPIEQIDAINEARRMENRQADLMGLYSSYLDDEDAVERRMPAEMPCEVMGHRIMVVCHQLKLELDIEPIFLSMALYDAKEKKKLTENFHFNLNSECTRQMLAAHVPTAALSTLSRSCIFDLLNPSADVFLVIRMEKVLQGDVNECVEPYMKEDKNREKVRASAQAACNRLGKFRMPFAWTAVSLSHIVSGSNSLEREGDKDNVSVSSQGSNSLDRKASTSSLEQLRRRANEAGGSLTRKGSVERRAEPPPSMSTFKRTTISLTSLFKQETDKLRDEDLYKYLAEIKRPSAAPRKLKCIPGTLKIEVMPCPDEIMNGLTPELAKLHPYGDDNVRPCKEIISFPLQPPPVPHYQYRNLLYVYPKEIFLAAFPSRARNITVRIQLLSGENQEDALPAIFGRSSCPEFSTEAYTTVLYHNKNPSLYDEIKLKLPADLGDQHHLLFTFLHVSCQRKPVPQGQEKDLTTVLGYSWIPLCRNGKLTCGEFSLPVLLEPPPRHYSYISPDVQLPGTRWLDNHKPVLLVTLHPLSTVHPLLCSRHALARQPQARAARDPAPAVYCAPAGTCPHSSAPGTRWLDNHKPVLLVTLHPLSTVHPLDSSIERFAIACEAIQEGNIPSRIGLTNMEAELRASIAELPTANVHTLARYSSVLLDKLVALLVTSPALAGAPLNIAQDAFTASLVALLVTSPALAGAPLNIAQDAFTCLAQLFTDITNMNEGATCDAHNRSSILSTYIQYQCQIPRPALTDQDVGLPLPPTGNVIDKPSSDRGKSLPLTCKCSKGESETRRPPYIQYQCQIPRPALTDQDVGLPLPPTGPQNMNEGATCDAHNRSSILSTYIQYQCQIPRPALTDQDVGLPLPPTGNVIDRVPIDRKGEICPSYS